MRLKILFGLSGTTRVALWWSSVQTFPQFITYKDKKWEMFSYDEDHTKNYDHILYFSEVQSSNAALSSMIFENIEGYLIDNIGNLCECGAIHTSFPDLHMLFCPKWEKW